MNLVLQHPQLTGDVVAAVGGRVGRPPDVQTPSLARWANVGIDRESVRAWPESQVVDSALVPEGRRLEDFRLIAFDMDSTMITIECIDEIADYAGVKAQVSAITEAAMRGEITDYAESLRRRVALLEGLPEDVLQRVYDERLRLSPGAEMLVAGAKAAGLQVLLVSGGFDFFTGRLRDRLGLDHVRSNALEVRDGRLTGRVLGEIVDASVKRETLLTCCERLGCSPQQAIAVGDGANDLKMMGAAGVSVAYRAKPVVRDACTHALSHTGLDGILNLFSA